jgi:hypothetical protein
MPDRTDIPALILVADPSPFITSEDAVVLSSSGFDVQPMKGTSHSMFREDFDAFMSAIDEWLVREAIRRWSDLSTVLHCKFEADELFYVRL